MDNVKFEPYEIEEYLKNNAEYKITSLMIANQAKTLTYGDILNYIYDLECQLAGADSRIDQLEEIVADQKRQINGYVSDQEVYVSGYQGIQKQNEQLKIEVKRLTEQSGKHVIESDHWKSMHDVLAESYTKLKNDFDNLEENYRLCKDANNVIKEKAAKLQKQVDELTLRCEILRRVQIAEVEMPTGNLKGHNDPVGEKGDCGFFYNCEHIKQAIKDTAKEIWEKANNKSYFKNCGVLLDYQDLVIDIQSLKEILESKGLEVE